MQTADSAPARGRARSLLRNPWVLTLIGVGALVLLLFLTVVGFRLARPGVLPGVEVEGVAVGGHDRTELVSEVDRLADERASEPVTAALDADEEREVSSARVEVGYEPLREDTVAAAWRRGRQANPLAALADHFRAFGSAPSVEVALAEEIDEGRLDEWVGRVAAQLRTEPVEGEVTIDGADVSVVLPQPGAEVDQEALREEASVAVLSPGEQRIVAASDPLEPDTDPDNVERVADDARQAVSGDVRLHRGDDAALTLAPEQIGEVLSVTERSGDEGARLEIVADAEALGAAVDEETVEALETDPVDAQIRLVDGEIEITPSEDGFRFDPEIAAYQVLEVATGDGEREAELRGRVEEPERTTADAEALQITERVSTFTTHHACCQGRVQNIQRMADIVRGVVLEPGEEFSINEHVGRRTRAKGFTDGGVIIRGEFEDAVGGGVSQFATTFFNAALEGGYEILDHQPHSYYISRYPEGRESTLNYGTIDVRIRNDSPYGVLIHTRYTSTSITVDFYGKDWVDVEITTGPRRNVRQPPVEYEEDKSLDPGEQRVITSGRRGFDVNYSRTRRFPDGSVDEEHWSHRYRPEPRIIARNTDEPEEDEDEEDEDEGGDGDSADGGGDDGGGDDGE